MRLSDANPNRAGPMHPPTEPDGPEEARHRYAEQESARIMDDPDLIAEVLREGIKAPPALADAIRRYGKLGTRDTSSLAHQLWAAIMAHELHEAVASAVYQQAYDEAQREV